MQATCTHTCSEKKCPATKKSRRLNKAAVVGVVVKKVVDKNSSFNFIKIEETLFASR